MGEERGRGDEEARFELHQTHRYCKPARIWGSFPQAGGKPSIGFSGLLLLLFWLVGVRHACFGPLGAAKDTEMNKTLPPSWKDLEKKGVSEHFALL